MGDSDLTIWSCVISPHNFSVPSLSHSIIQETRLQRLHLYLWVDLWMTLAQFGSAGLGKIWDTDTVNCYCHCLPCLPCCGSDSGYVLRYYTSDGISFIFFFITLIFSFCSLSLDEVTVSWQGSTVLASHFLLGMSSCLYLGKLPDIRSLKVTCFLSELQLLHSSMKFNKLKMSRNILFSLNFYLH